MNPGLQDDLEMITAAPRWGGAWWTGRSSPGYGLTASLPLGIREGT